MRLTHKIVHVVGFGALLAVACVAMGQPTGPQMAVYPVRPVRYIIPYPPGGNTVIGTEYLAKATADGYTFGWTGGPMFILHSLMPNLPYDVLRDFAGVVTIGKSRSVLVLHPSVVAGNVQALIALIKVKPGKFNFASSGVGSIPHLSGELFNQMTGTKMIHIPYKGSGPAITDLLSGRVQLSFQTSITMIPFIRAGRLKPLVMSGETRLPALPGVPTYAEVGLADFGLTSVSGIIVPAKTPQAIIDKISKDLAAILGQPDTRESMEKQGSEPYISTPGQTTAVIKEEVARYAKIIKSAGITYQP